MNQEQYKAHRQALEKITARINQIHGTMFSVEDAQMSTNGVLGLAGRLCDCQKYGAWLASYGAGYEIIDWSNDSDFPTHANYELLIDSDSLEIVLTALRKEVA